MIRDVEKGQRCAVEFYSKSVMNKSCDQVMNKSIQFLGFVEHIY